MYSFLKLLVLGVLAFYVYQVYRTPSPKYGRKAANYRSVTPSQLERFGFANESYRRREQQAGPGNFGNTFESAAPPMPRRVDGAQQVPNVLDMGSGMGGSRGGSGGGGQGRGQGHQRGGQSGMSGMGGGQGGMGSGMSGSDSSGGGRRGVQGMGQNGGGPRGGGQRGG